MKLINQKAKEERNKQINMRELLGLPCRIGVYLFLFVFVVVYPFYAPEGYIQIATNKYRFFREMALITAKVMIPLIALYYLSALLKKNTDGEEKKKKPFSLTDLFVLLFFEVNCISFFFSKYKKEASWGTNGWYMGFFMMLAFIGIYFLISRFYDGKVDLLPPFMGVSAVVFAWGLLNRFSVYPIDMHYDNISFISGIGNINWFCGYWSVFFVIGVALYVVAEKRSMRIMAAIHSVLSLAMGVVEGSDSAYISFGVVFFFLFLVSFQKTIYMKRWLDLCIFYCGACQIMRIVAAFGPKELTPEYTGWTGLNLINPTITFMLGNVTLAALIVFVLLRVWMERTDKRYAVQKDIEKKQGKEEAERTEGEWIQKIVWVKYTVAGLLASGAVVYLLLLIVNTRAPGILGPLSKYSVFLFDRSWGSSRGATWGSGLSIYRTLSWKERLFGVGPDCFAIYAYSVPELAAKLREEWGSSRLTNAHNECITFLVNIGIFGLLSFIGIFFGSVKSLLKKAKGEPLCYVFAAALLSYFFHNQFSFSQVVNIPYAFLMLGMGENLLRNSTKHRY